MHKDFVVWQHRGSGLDMNVLEAYKLGMTGQDVVVSILDDGIEKDHPDLMKNYVSFQLSVMARVSSCSINFDSLDWFFHQTTQGAW